MGSHHRRQFAADQRAADLHCLLDKGKCAPRCPRWDKRRWRDTLLWGSPHSGSDRPYHQRSSPANPERVGSLYEALEKMPEEKRPDYFAIYPTWFPGFEGSGVLDQEIARFSLSSRPEVAGIVGGSEVVVSRADWSLAQSGNTFRGQGSLKDSLDVADLASEKEHDYHIEMPLIGLEPANLLRRERSPEGEMIVDGGRGVQGAEQFTIRGLSPNHPVEVWMRTTSAPFALQVQADGQEVGQWIFQPSARSSGWQQATFRIPAQAVRSGSLRVRLSPQNKHR